jgi:hypothetical protein
MGSKPRRLRHAQLLLRRGVLPVEEYTQVDAFEDAMTAMADSIAARTPKAVLLLQPA